MTTRRGGRHCPWILGALLGLAGAGAAQDGQLEEVREAVRGGGDDGDGRDDEHEHDWDDEWDERGLFDDEQGRDPFEAFFDNTVGVLFEYTVLLPFRVPRTALDDEEFARGFFQPYPHRDGPGYWRVDADVAGGRAWSIRPRSELARDFDDLERVGFGLQLEHASRFGFDGAWSRWREDLDGGVTDELDLYDANLVYRFAQGPRAAFRAGLGLNGLHDAPDDDFGVNATYGADFLLGSALTLGLECDLGTLGDAGLVHLRPTLGFVLERFELFASFDHYDIDGAELRSYGLGLRAWF